MKILTKKDVRKFLSSLRREISKNRLGEINWADTTTDNGFAEEDRAISGSFVSSLTGWVKKVENAEAVQSDIYFSFDENGKGHVSKGDAITGHRNPPPKFDDWDSTARELARQIRAVTTRHHKIAVRLARRPESEEIDLFQYWRSNFMLR